MRAPEDPSQYRADYASLQRMWDACSRRVRNTTGPVPKHLQFLLENAPTSLRTNQLTHECFPHGSHTCAQGPLTMLSQ